MSGRPSRYRQRGRGGADKPIVGVMSVARDPARTASGRARDRASAYRASAARALGRAGERAEWLRQPRGIAPALDQPTARRRTVVARALEDTDAPGWRPPRPAAPAAYGLPLFPSGRRDVGRAATAAARARLPRRRQVRGAGCHKTETGGVVLGLKDEEAVRAAAERIGWPVVVQPFVGAARAARRRRAGRRFGPLVAFGPAGVLAELIGEARSGSPRSRTSTRWELVTGGKAGRLVAASAVPRPRTSPRWPTSCCGSRCLGEDLPELAELDLNPVMALPDGCVVVDARVRVQAPSRPFSAKSW